MPPQDRINQVSAEEQIARHLRERLNFRGMGGLKDADLTIRRDDQEHFTVRVSDRAIDRIGPQVHELVAQAIADLTGQSFALQGRSGMSGVEYPAEGNMADIAIDLGKSRRGGAGS